MSNKQKITLTLDTEIYFKLKMSDINASEMFNQFLKQHFKTAETSEAALYNEVEETKRKLTILEYELNKRKTERETEQQKKLSEKDEERNRLLNAVPLGNDFYSRLTREKMLAEHPELADEIKKRVEGGKK